MSQQSAGVRLAWAVAPHVLVVGASFTFGWTWDELAFAFWGDLVGLWLAGVAIPFLRGKGRSATWRGDVFGAVFAAPFLVLTVFFIRAAGPKEYTSVPQLLDGMPWGALLPLLVLPAAAAVLREAVAPPTAGRFQAFPRLAGRIAVAWMALFAGALIEGSLAGISLLVGFIVADVALALTNPSESLGRMVVPPTCRPHGDGFQLDFQGSHRDGRPVPPIVVGFAELDEVRPLGEDEVAPLWAAHYSHAWHEWKRHLRGGPRPRALLMHGSRMVLLRGQHILYAMPLRGESPARLAEAFEQSKARRPTGWVQVGP